MRGNKYFIFGIVFLAIGITMLVTGAVSRTMAYGDLVIAFAFFALSTRSNKKSDDDKDGEKTDDKNDK